MQEAIQHKISGNQFFKDKNYDQALESYQTALQSLPPPSALTSATQSSPSAHQLTSDDHREARELRKVLHANSAQALINLLRYQDAVQACTLALEDDENYVKALHRRAIANTHIATWTSMSEAQEDYKRMLSLPLSSGRPSDSQLQAKIDALERPITEAKERETAEVMGKLKDVGNSILGRFGLSLDNFVMEQNDQGGYGVQFKSPQSRS